MTTSSTNSDGVGQKCATVQNNQFCGRLWYFVCFRAPELMQSLVSGVAKLNSPVGTDISTSNLVVGGVLQWPDGQVEWANLDRGVSTLY